jgi:biopolymer transport protein ExbD
VLLVPQRARPVRRISLTPLIDIVFILLLFFILETNFLGLGELALNLPRQEDGTESRRQALQIQVFADGRLWLAGQSLNIGSLADHLTGLGYPSDTPVVLSVEDAVRVQQLVTLVDTLDGLSLTQVQVVPLER